VAKQQACSVPDALQGGRSRVEAKGYKIKLYTLGWSKHSQLTHRTAHQTSFWGDTAAVQMSITKKMRRPKRESYH
jgi:hypothetical protein